MSRRAWLVCALAALLALETGLAALGHLDRGALERRAAQGDARERVHALHVLASRDVPRVFSESDAEAMWRRDEPLLREWIVSPSFRAALARPEALDPLVAALPEDAAGRRVRFFHGHDRVRGEWLSLEDLRAFLADRDR